MTIQMPTVLRKSADQNSIQQSFFILGILDRSQQGPDVDRLMGTYKKDLPIERKKRLEAEFPLQLKEWRLKGIRITEDKFEEYDHLIDAESDGIENSLSESFALQHLRQRCSDMTNSRVVGNFPLLSLPATPLTS